MKVNEVPQDNVDKCFTRGDTSDMYYAVDDKGDVVQVWCKGWVESENSWRNLMILYNELAEDAKDRIKKGETSPIEYYMHKSHLDLDHLSPQIGFSKWKIKKHFKLKVFEKLNDKSLKIYADFFNIDINELKNFKKGI
jgi:hypothetical protein